MLALPSRSQVQIKRGNRIRLSSTNVKFTPMSDINQIHNNVNGKLLRRKQ